MGLLSDIVGSVLDFGGNLLGMESDRAVAGADRQEAQRQFNLQREDNHNATQIRVNDALKAGINPLAALGVSSNVSPTISAGGSHPGHHMSRAFSQLGDFIKKRFGSQAESDELDNEAKRLRNSVMREELKHIRQVGREGGEVVPPTGEQSLFVPVYDLDGRPRLLINQDVTENDSDNAAYISSLKSAISSGQIHPLSGKVMSRQLKMKIADDYKRRTGRNIENLDELYFSPSEVAVAAYQLARGI